MKISIKLPSGFESQFKKNITKELKKQVQNKAPDAIVQIKSLLQSKIISILTSSAEHNTIISSRVVRELGIQGIENRLMNVYQTIANNISVTFIKNSPELIQINIGILKSDYSDILGLQESTFLYSGSKGSGILNWLEWLLTKGGSPIVVGYSFVNRSGKGRLNQGFMKPSPNRSWSVPSEASGTENDNFITRALSKSVEKLSPSIEKIIQGVYK